MSPAALIQTTPLERLEAIQQHLNRGGSGRGLLLALLGLLLLGVVVVLLHWIQRRAQPHDIDSPARLFRQLVRRLGLSPPQRTLLRRMARDLQLPHPTVLLLGRRLFDLHSHRWLGYGDPAHADRHQHVADLASALFPPGPGNKILTPGHRAGHSGVAQEPRTDSQAP